MTYKGNNFVKNIIYYFLSFKIINNKNLKLKIIALILLITFYILSGKVIDDVSFVFKLPTKQADLYKYASFYLLPIPALILFYRKKFLYGILNPFTTYFLSYLRVIMGLIILEILVFPIEIACVAIFNLGVEEGLIFKPFFKHFTYLYYYIQYSYQIFEVYKDKAP